jgi:hypothetical protein
MSQQGEASKPGIYEAETRIEEGFESIHPVHARGVRACGRLHARSGE